MNSNAIYSIPPFTIHMKLATFISTIRKTFVVSFYIHHLKYICGEYKKLYLKRFHLQIIINKLVQSQIKSFSVSLSFDFSITIVPKIPFKTISIKEKQRNVSKKPEIISRNFLMIVLYHYKLRTFIQNDYPNI